MNTLHSHRRSASTISAFSVRTGTTSTSAATLRISPRKLISSSQHSACVLCSTKSGVLALTTVHDHRDNEAYTIPKLTTWSDEAGAGGVGEIFSKNSFLGKCYCQLSISLDPNSHLLRRSQSQVPLTGRKHWSGLSLRAACSCVPVVSYQRERSCLILCTYVVY